MKNKAAAALSMALMLFAPAAVLLRPTPALAQRGPVNRTAEGKVEGKDGAVLRGAVVYLKDTKTLSVKSYVSDENGNFHFGQLNPGTDYDLWAETEGKRSKTKNISQFNNRNDFHFTLKID